MLTITSDNGKEFAGHEATSKRLDAEFYFAPPYASCERGTHENTNGLIGQYFPEDRDFTSATHREIDAAMVRLNNRPMKRLGFPTPREESFNQSSIASKLNPRCFLQDCRATFSLIRSAPALNLVALFLVTGLLTPKISFALTPADAAAAQRQAEIIQHQQQDNLQRTAPEPSPVEGLDTKSLQPKITVPSIGATCREINTITISDAPHLSASVRKHIVSEFSKRCLNVGDIEKILAEITKDYIDRGYITTRAYLGPQDLSKGHLEIHVVEGKVEKIMIDDGNSKSVSVANIFPGVVGHILNLRDLEQGIDQINRLSSNNARLDIQPGDAPGTSIVVVHNRPGTPLHLNVFYGNEGVPSTGITQAGITPSIDNLFGLNESISVSRVDSIPQYFATQFSRADSFNFRIPFGYTTVSVSSNHLQYASQILLPSGLTANATGNSTFNSMSVDEVSYRDQVNRVSTAATITTKTLNNYLDGQYLGVSSHNLTVLDLDGTLDTILAGGTLTLTFGYAKGLNAMGALIDPANLSGSIPHAQYSMYKAGFNYRYPFHLFSKAASFSSQMTGQKANEALYNSEQILIGGISSVRGFVINTLSGDNGYYVRNEISVFQPLAIGDQTLMSRIYAGYDIGEVYNIAPNLPEGRLTGMAVGISTNWNGFEWDLFNTRPLTLPSFMTKESNQTWFQISHSI